MGPGVVTVEDAGIDVAVEHVCQRCRYRLQSTVGVLLLDDPDVLLFHSERGVDLNSEPFWHFDWCVSDEHTEIVSTNPLQLELTLECDGDRLRVRIDDEGAVTDTAVVESLAY